MSGRVITVLEIDASQAKSAVADYEAAMRKAETLSERSIKLHEKVQEAIERQTAAYTKNTSAMENAKAANDNASRSFEISGDAIMRTVNAAKIGAAALYALSPAFRAAANPLIAQSMKATGAALAEMSPAAAGLVGTIASRLIPALSFVGKIALPIQAVILAWQGLNHVVGLGAGLLEKYANAQRQFFSSDVDENLAKLTKFQNETLSLQQVQYATDLGVRLAEARKTFSDFWKVQFNLTDPALKLQNAWVVIVETIAKAVELANRLTSLPNLQNWIQRNFVQGSQAPNWILPPDGAAEMSLEEKRTRGVKMLSAAMGNSFGARFSGDIAALADTDKAVKKTMDAINEQRSAFDRAVDSIAKHVAVMGANARSVGQGAAEQERLRAEAILTEAAFRTGGLDAVEKYSAAIFDLSRNAGIAAEELLKARLESRIQFDRETMFMSRDERSIARDMQILYGDKWKENMESALAQQMRMNQLLGEAKETGTSFVKDFVSGLMSGKSAMESLGNAAMNLSMKLTDKAITSLFSGDLVGAAVAGVGAAVSYMFGNSQKKKQEQAKMWQEVIDINTRAQLASLDTSTRAGAMASLEIQQQGERLAAMKKGWAVFLATENLHREQMAKLNEEWNKREEDARRALADRLFAATNDATTIDGALLAFDRAAAREREELAKTMASLLPDLDRTLAAERLRVIEDFNKRALEEERQRAERMMNIAKSIRDYLDGLKLGNLSTLSMEEQVAAAREAYERELALARGGDETALAGITKVADPYLEKLRQFFGPTSAYGAFFSQITADLEQLAASATGMRLGGIVGSYVGGGLVGNGIWNVDSVLARYARGGSIALAGGEHVTRAPSVNPRTLPTLEHINRTGAPPANDNGDLARSVQSLVREVAYLRAENARLQTEGHNRTAAVERAVDGMRTDIRQREGERRIRAAG